MIINQKYMSTFIEELQRLRDKIAESQIYSEQAREALAKAHEMAENINTTYLLETTKN